ncbi:MAG TPA: hypothetical protein VN081_03665 [Dongiaceae bacterium]|nr:hypothetical protein [Dongiaceae bacterium]
MNETKHPVLSKDDLTIWARHRLTLLLIATIVIAIIMTVISVIIYNISGAAQLDLSRPGYRSVSSQVEKNDTITTFSSAGPVNKDTIQQFMTVYDQQAAKAKGVDAFNGDPLNPDVLEFGSPDATGTNNQ